MVTLLGEPTAEAAASWLFYSHPHLLESRDPRTIKESSINETISEVVSPRRRSSPRFLKEPNWKDRPLQSAMTCFSLASMSFSFTALMQISCSAGKKGRQGSGPFGIFFVREFRVFSHGNQNKVPTEGKQEKKGQTQKSSNKHFRMLAVILFVNFFKFFSKKGHQGSGPLGIFSSGEFRVFFHGSWNKHQQTLCEPGSSGFWLCCMHSPLTQVGQTIHTTETPPSHESALQAHLTDSSRTNCLHHKNLTLTSICITHSLLI